MKNILFIATIGVVVLTCRAGVVVDAQSPGTPLGHYWSVGVGAGRVNEGLRVGWHEHLVDVRGNCGFRYVRMHDTFNDDMFVCFPKKKGTGKGERGTGMVYSWQYIDDVYDRMLTEGVRPFVEFSFFPSCLAAEGTRRQMWYRNCVTIDTDIFYHWAKLPDYEMRRTPISGLDVSNVQVKEANYAVRNALYINEEYGIQYYDALIVATAEKLHCHEIISEALSVKMCKYCIFLSVKMCKFAVVLSVKMWYHILR